jgi:endonuclease/exonuclease/phosphatase family metal-dependent hydrolase
MRPLGSALTFPADQPDRQLDHILTDDTRLRVDHCESVSLPLSDHRALVIDVSRD